MCLFHIADMLPNDTFVFPMHENYDTSVAPGQSLSYRQSSAAEFLWHFLAFP
jgi:hypothetical protein